MARLIKPREGRESQGLESSPVQLGPPMPRLSVTIAAPEPASPSVTLQLIPARRSQ